jgi:hypothetical protein
MSYDIENIDIDKKVDYDELSTELLKSRLVKWINHHSELNTIRVLKYN